MEISNFTYLAADMVNEFDLQGIMDCEWGVNDMESSFYGGYSNLMTHHEQDRPLKQPRISIWDSYESSISIHPNVGVGVGVGVMKPITTNKIGNQTRHYQNLAERKRRERLNHKFMGLASLLPGLKRTDRHSILVHAIKRVKELEEKVKGLEEKAKKKKTTNMESVSFDIKKDEESCSLSPLEARFDEREVLISIQCERREGVFEKVVGEIEKLHLCVVNSNLLTYGDSCLSISLIAEKKEEACNVSMEELVSNLPRILKI